jgi:hypothetical protein
MQWLVGNALVLLIALRHVWARCAVGWRIIWNDPSVIIGHPR